jgi:hypothetical protein
MTINTDKDVSRLDIQALVKDIQKLLMGGSASEIPARGCLRFPRKRKKGGKARYEYELLAGFS